MRIIQLVLVIFFAIIPAGGQTIPAWADPSADVQHENLAELLGSSPTGALSSSIVDAQAAEHDVSVTPWFAACSHRHSRASMEDSSQK